jgi:gentisate 1,2-dioxygenase
LYRAFRGSGTTVIDGQKFEWEQGVVSLWSWHSHQNRSQAEAAILFSVSDLAGHGSARLYHEEQAMVRDLRRVFWMVCIGDVSF